MSPNDTALARMLAVRPAWTGVVRAGDALSLPATTILHAGPPFDPGEALPLPVRNAVCAALVFEGLAADSVAAAALLEGGGIRLEPAQGWGVVTPLAAVVSASMMLHAVSDGVAVRYAPLNEGAGRAALRFGTDDAGVAARLDVVHRQMAPVLHAVCAEPMPLLPLAVEALAQGDDLHGRLVAAGPVLARAVAARVGEGHPAFAFLDLAPQAFLALWMAASALVLAAGEGVAGSSLVVGAGGNGLRTGIRLAADPDTWRVGPAAPPSGPDLPGGAGVVRLGAIGDSAVIDALGLGALALDAAPQLAADLGVAPASGARFLAGLHPVLGRPVGLDAARVHDPSDCPTVVLAALDAAGHLGLVGRGLARHPAACYGLG